jgi:hypothetical protein
VKVKDTILWIATPDWEKNPSYYGAEWYKQAWYNETFNGETALLINADYIRSKNVSFPSYRWRIDVTSKSSGHYAMQ